MSASLTTTPGGLFLGTSAPCGFFGGALGALDQAPRTREGDSKLGLDAEVPPARSGRKGMKDHANVFLPSLL